MFDASNRRERGNIKDQEQLRNTLLVAVPLTALRICKILLVEPQKGRAVENGEEGDPFLKEDVDVLVREQARRNFGYRLLGTK